MNAPLTPAQVAGTLAAGFASRAATHDREGSFPHANFAELQEAGLLALAAPRALGGQGAPVGVLAEVIGALGHACPATALVLTMQYMQHRSMGREGAAWPPALAAQLVQESVHEVSLVNALRVEPELGSPARGGLPATVARRTADGWRISGHKVYSTGAPILRWLVVWARTDEATPRVGSFVVRSDAPGVKVLPTWDHLGLRASGSHDVLFDDVALPAEHALELRQPQDWAYGPAAAQSAQAMQAEMALLLGALYTGVARAARDWLVGFLQERKPASLGAALASLPRAQEALGHIEGLLLVNQRLLGSLAQTLDAGGLPASAESGLVKAQTTHNAVAVVQGALALSSNHGLSRHNPLERHLRDALCGRVHTPQDDSVYVAAGKHALGL
ncbi:acyl-CoA dehydrogenase family protein [Variovorax sp. HJSM1_2]|uniref:acyl-CoA dehydrogenase family protein n=1 Tax=Variovorax sp. HJSM1_2 TaxID=3366263 RepID=UPI003BDDA743